MAKRKFVGCTESTFQKGQYYAASFRICNRRCSTKLVDCLEVERATQQKSKCAVEYFESQICQWAKGSSCRLYQEEKLVIATYRNCAVLLNERSQIVSIDTLASIFSDSMTPKGRQIKNFFPPHILPFLTSSVIVMLKKTQSVLT